jgi:23S rRNA (guanosine2251-2'-O)-methyltransferase
VKPRRPDRENRPPGDYSQRNEPAGRGFARQVVYGRNPVHEALRGRRRVYKIWATQAAAKEDWRPAKVTIASEREIAERAGSDAHQGVAALVDGYPYADADALLSEP